MWSKRPALDLRLVTSFSALLHFHIKSELSPSFCAHKTYTLNTDLLLKNTVFYGISLKAQINKLLLAAYTQVSDILSDKKDLN